MKPTLHNTCGCVASTLLEYGALHTIRIMSPLFEVKVLKASVDDHPLLCSLFSDKYNLISPI